MDHGNANWIKQCINVRGDVIHLKILTGKFGLGMSSFEITFLCGVQDLSIITAPKVFFFFQENHKAKTPLPQPEYEKPI